MADLSTRTIIRCPVSEAATRLAHYFACNGVVQGELTRLILDVDLPRFESARRTQLTDAVVVTVRPVRADQGNRRQHPWQYEVDWSLDESQDFPAVAGRLEVEPSADYNAFSLCLTAQSGVVKRAEPTILDAGTAREIVKEVSAAIVLSIAADIERAFRSDERAKLAHLTGSSRAPVPDQS